MSDDGSHRQAEKSGKERIFPLRIRSWILAGYVIAALLPGGVLLWSWLTTIEGAVIAPGRFVVESHPKAVQHLESGIIADILVKEGEEVAKGDVLIRLDGSSLRAERAIVREHLDALRAERARLLAELEDAPDITFPPDLTRRAAASPKLAQLLRTQRRLLRMRRARFRNMEDIIERQATALLERISGLRQGNDARRRQIALLKQEIATVERLLQKGNATLPRLLELKRALVRVEGEYGETNGLIAQTKQKIEELNSQFLHEKNSFREKITERLKEILPEIVKLEQSRIDLDRKIGRLDIRAPVSGRVHNMQVHTIGGVVTAGETIMEIVPSKDRLVVQARVSVLDIEQLHAGQKARLHLTAYNAPDMPIIEGRVARISADVLQDERSGQPFYKVEVDIPSEEWRRLGRDRRLIPGMPTEVFISTYPRSPLHIMMKPFFDSMQRAFRFG